MKNITVLFLLLLSFFTACKKDSQRPSITSGCFEIPIGTPLIKTTYSRLHYAYYEYDNYNRIIRETVKYPMQDTVVFHYNYYDDSLVIKSDYFYHTINYLTNSNKTFSILSLDQNCFITKYANHNEIDFRTISRRVNNNTINYTSHEYSVGGLNIVNEVVDSFYYDLTKVNTIGFRNFGITFSGQSSNNLLTKIVKKTKYGNTNMFYYDTIYYDYDFDLKGRITRATSNSNFLEPISSKPQVIIPYLSTDTLMKYFTYYEAP